MVPQAKRPRAAPTLPCIQALPVAPRPSVAARAWQPWHDARGGLSAAWPLLAIGTAILLVGPLVQ